MSNKPVTVNELDISKVTFTVGPSKPGRNPSVYFKYNGRNLSILVPKLGFPGGVLVRDDEESGRKSYTLIGSLNNCDPYAKTKSEDASDIGKFYNFLLDLEDKIIANAVENSVKWFGKKRSEDGLRDGWKRILGVSTNKVDGEYVPNGKYPPSFRIKVPVYDGRVDSDIVDKSKNPLYATPDSLLSIFSKGVEANTVISGTIYIMAGGGFGVTWRLQYAQVFPRSKLTAADIFDVIEDNEEQEEETVAETATTTEVPTEETMEDTARTPERPASSAVATPGAPARKRRTALQ